MQKEGRKKQVRSYKQQSKATQHTQGSHFFKEKYELPWVGFEPTTLHTLDKALYQLRQLSWLGLNLTSHSAPDEHGQYLTLGVQEALRGDVVEEHVVSRDDLIQILRRADLLLQPMPVTLHHLHTCSFQLYFQFTNTYIHLVSFYRHIHVHTFSFSLQARLVSV